jgi:hypothetical protein
MMPGPNVLTDFIVYELNELLKPMWGAEKWILEGWNSLDNDEKALIKSRMDDLFHDGLPFELKSDKLLYIYTFSMLAQFEVLAIQVPLKFEEKMTTAPFKRQMRVQLLDEIFHGMVFTKIVYLLCAPYYTPPEYNEHIEELCNFIRNEECPKVGLVLLNLVAEGWIEEIFKSLHQANIAPEVFATILEDEHRHVCEADLYCAVGLPEKKILTKKLRRLEELLLTSLSMQPKYATSINVLLGPQATQQFLTSLHEKHTHQLKKINLVPGKQWELLIQLGRNFFSELALYSENVHHEAAQEVHEVEMTPIRKVFMTQWDNPGDPTMVCQFHIDVSCLDFFNKKFPPETLTTLMIQAVSHLVSMDNRYRHFLSYKKMYQTRGSYVAVVVKLPHCGDHIGNIVFRNCHELTSFELTEKIKRTVQMMTYCYNKREQIEQEHPELKHKLDKMLYDYTHDAYPYPTSGSSAVSISSIGFCGYSQAVSPLRKEEGLKVTLLTVERKPVWNDESQSFVPIDMLPVSISADHRIFDGNLPIPKMLSHSFQHVFQNMLKNNIEQEIEPENYKKIAEAILSDTCDFIIDKANQPSNKKALAQLIENDFELRGEKITQLSTLKKIIENIRSGQLEFKYKGKQITKETDLHLLAEQMLHDYLNFNADEAKKNTEFTATVDQIVAENLEVGYLTLAGLQSYWCDFIDQKEVFRVIYEKTANRNSKVPWMV